MRSYTHASFWNAYRRLPDQVRKKARISYRFFMSDPRHPSLEFKLVSQRCPVYSVRVSIDYRALGLLERDEIIGFWIGPHHEYEKLLKRVK